MTMTKQLFKFHKIPRILELGSKYTIQWNSSNKLIDVIFIKVTKLGYNFLDLKTNKCLLKQHIYISKCPNHVGKDLWFFTNAKLKIIKI
jgi:hypothetical protein